MKTRIFDENNNTMYVFMYSFIIHYFNNEQQYSTYPTEEYCEKLNYYIIYIYISLVEE